MISQADYIAMLQRMGTKARSAAAPPAAAPAVVRERELHDQIQAECRRRGWIAYHGSMAHATHRTIGEPDFIILRDGGRTLQVEVKKPGGKLRTEQLALKIWAEKLGHQVHTVFTYKDFLDLL